MKYAVKRIFNYINTKAKMVCLHCTQKWPPHHAKKWAKMAVFGVYPNDLQFYIRKKVKMEKWGV